MAGEGRGRAGGRGAGGWEGQGRARRQGGGGGVTGRVQLSKSMFFLIRSIFCVAFPIIKAVRWSLIRANTEWYIIYLTLNYATLRYIRFRYVA